MRRPSAHLHVGLGLLLALAVAGCRDRQASSPAADAPEQTRETLQAPVESKMAAQGRVADGLVVATSEPPPLESMAAARKLIRTGQVALEVPDYGNAAAKATQLAESHGGYLAESHSMRGAR